MTDILLDQDKNNILHKALSYKNSYSIIEFLVSINNKNINEINRYKCLPLNVAIEHHQNKSFIYLFHFLKPHLKWYPNFLEFCAKHENFHLFKFLIQYYCSHSDEFDSENECYNYWFHWKNQAPTVINILFIKHNHSILEYFTKYINEYINIAKIDFYTGDKMFEPLDLDSNQDYLFSENEEESFDENCNPLHFLKTNFEFLCQNNCIETLNLFFHSSPFVFPYIQCFLKRNQFQMFIKLWQNKNPLEILDENSLNDSYKGRQNYNFISTLLKNRNRIFIDNNEKNILSILMLSPNLISFFNNHKYFLTNSWRKEDINKLLENDQIFVEKIETTLSMFHQLIINTLPVEWELNSNIIAYLLADFLFAYNKNV
jgi:hypothetical protein